MLDKNCPSLGAALSYAQNVACREWKEPNALFVKDIDGTALFKIERTEDGTVYTTAV